MKRLVTETQAAAVSAAIARVEQQTDAEIVMVLAERSDDYRYIPTLWAAILALLLPFALNLSPLWLDARQIALLQLVLFIIVAGVFRWPPLLLRLIPRRVRNWRAGNLARRQFLDNNLHHTRAETGVLVFISELEHYVEIIADRGINARVPEQAWQQIVDQLIEAIKTGRIESGLVRCVEACGELLIEHVPLSDQKNELPNHLIML